MNLSDYFESQPRGTAIRLAKAIGAFSSDMSSWTMGKRPVPAERCPAIERATGGLVRCETLRPDVDWAYLRNTTQQAPAHTHQLPSAAESVACPANLVCPPGDLRAGVIRRHVSRRAQEAVAERDRRAKGGPPFQSLEKGVA